MRQMGFKIAVIGMLFLMPIISNVWAGQEDVSYQGRGNQKMRIVDKLGLDDKTKDALVSIMQANRDKMKAYREKLHTKRVELKKLLTAGVIDVKKADVIIDEITKAQGELLKTRVEEMKQIQELLGPEKYREFVKLQRQRRGGRGHRRDMRGRGRRRGGNGMRGAIEEGINE